MKGTIHAIEGGSVLTVDGYELACRLFEAMMKDPGQRPPDKSAQECFYVVRRLHPEVAEGIMTTVALVIGYLKECMGGTVTTVTEAPAAIQ